MTHTLLVTGGAGFIGSAVVREVLLTSAWRVVNVDKLAYSGNPATRLMWLIMRATIFCTRYCGSRSNARRL